MHMEHTHSKLTSREGIGNGKTSINVKNIYFLTSSLCTKPFSGRKERNSRRNLLFFPIESIELVAMLQPVNV